MNETFEYKNVLETFRCMHALNEKKCLQIIEPNSSLHGYQIEIWKNENYFEFSIDKSAFDITPSDSSSLFDTCILIADNIKYSFYRDSLRSISVSLAVEKTKGKLTSVIETVFENSDSQYFRLIQKVKDPPKIGYLNGVISLKTDQKETLLYAGGYNQIVIDNFKIDTIRLDVENENYIIIDSCSVIELKKFKSLVEAYFVAYGFVFGETIGKETYYCSSDSNSFEKINQTIFQSKSEDISIETFPIFNRNIPSQKGLLIQFPKNVFENICNNYLNIEAYSRTLKTINVGLKASSPLGKCILFSSALETISTVVQNSKKHPKPINEKNLENGNLIKKIEKIIKEDKYLTESEKSFLIEKKINYLNSPTFQDKTIEAFNSFGIELPNSLMNVIKYRNKYLHGSIPEEIQFGEDMDNLHRAHEIQFLVSILILKSSGYSGYVQNKSAIAEYHAHKKNNLDAKIKLKQAIYYKI